MYKYFLSTYKDKTEEELIGIVASRKVQHKDAVKAAAKILHEKFGHEASISQKKKVRYSSTIKFFKTFSFREIYSILVASLLFLAVNMVLIDHGLNEHFENYFWLITVILYLSSILLCHYWYRKEHKRRNRFWPRVMNTSVLTAVIFTFLELKNTYISEFENALVDVHLATMPFAFVFISLIFEVAISAVIHLKEAIWRI